MLKTEV